MQVSSQALFYQEPTEPRIFLCNSGQEIPQTDIELRIMQRVRHMKKLVRHDGIIATLSPDDSGIIVQHLPKRISSVPCMVMSPNPQQLIHKTEADETQPNVAA